MKFSSQTIYCIIGLMIESTYAVIMDPASLEITTSSNEYREFQYSIFAIVCTLITDLEKLKTVLKNKNIEVESENDAKIEYT